VELTYILPRDVVSQLEDVGINLKRHTYAAAAQAMLEKIRAAQ
jgi:hypothetical protein